MPGPFDYSLQQPNIAGSVLGGIQAGQQVQAQRQAQEQAQQYRTDLQNYLSKPTAEAASQMIAKYPGQQKALSAGWDIYSKGQQDSLFSSGTQAYSAINSGKPEIAKQILDKEIAAHTNSGQDVTQLESLRKTLDQDPQAASAGLGLALAGFDPERWGKVAGEFRANQKAPYELGKAQAEAGKAQTENRFAPETANLANQKTRADIENTNSQAIDRGERLGFDRDKLRSDIELKIDENLQKAGEIPESARTLINKASTDAVMAEQLANRQDDLAGQFEKLGSGGYGAFSKASEWVANATGRQDEWTTARNEFTRLKNTQAIKSLPPGSASDADVKMALKGFPDDTANSKVVAEFLRGMAKMSRLDSALQNAQSEWVGSVKNLGKTPRDINIDGVNVPKGTSFSDFARDYVVKKEASLGAGQAKADVPGRSYMRFANPQGGQ